MKIDYYPLVNRMVSTLRLRERTTKQHPAPESHFFEKPFITIAREPGSGGAPIAKRVAERLAFSFYDEEIVEELAKSTKKRKSIIKEVDEKGRNYIDDFIHSVLNPEYVDEEKFIKVLSRIIVNYAHKGNCVILGRGANFMTPFARGLHVNIVAPYEVRVQRAMQYEGFNEAKARKVIEKVEKERKEFTQTYFRKKIAAHSQYDLTLNTAHYSIDQATDIIMLAFRRKFPAFKRLKATFFG